MASIGSAGSAAAQQLMQASNSMREMSNRQLTTVNSQLQETKASALQNTAKQTAAAVDRKGNTIDLMV